LKREKKEICENKFINLKSNKYRNIMKKIVLFLSIFFALGALMNSCLDRKVVIDEEPSPEPPDPPDPPDPAKKYVKVNTGIETTPFALQRFTNETIGLFVYKNEDMLGNLGNLEAQLENGYHEFEYTGRDSTGYVFGYYPYASNAVTGKVYSGFLDSIQNQQVVSGTAASAILPPDLANRMLMISTPSSEFSFKGETGNIQFRNVFSLFRFVITKEAALKDFDNQKIKSFQMYLSYGEDMLTPSPSVKLAGSYTINIKTAASGSLSPEISKSSSVIAGTISTTDNSVISSNSADSSIVIWAVTAPFNVYNSKLVFRMETENADNIRYSTINTFDLTSVARNTLNPYNIVLKKENVHTDDLVNNSHVGHPANTYIISDAGTYAISTKTPTGTVKEGDRADWLWASKEGGGNTFEINDLIRDIEYDSREGVIKFTAVAENETLNKGNVIIALRDASDNIVWSWHIWLTDKPQDLTYESDKIFMDRNLGALTSSTSPAVDAYGFVYQWGRKDPFYGGDGNTADEGTSLFLVAERNTIRNVLNWTNKPLPGDMNDASSNPMQFIFGNSSLTDEALEDWMNESDNALWGGGVGVEKTENDPCPDGYRVPSKADFDILHNAYENSGSNYYFKRISETYWEYRNIVPVINSAWPAAGRRQGSPVSPEGNGGQLKYSGTGSSQGQLFYWTRTPMNVSGISWRGASHRLYSTNTNLLYPDHEVGGRADAYSVRCVKE
jgi:hypothetical protein